MDCLIHLHFHSSKMLLLSFLIGADRHLGMLFLVLYYVLAAIYLSLESLQIYQHVASAAVAFGEYAGLQVSDRTRRAD